MRMLTKTASDTKLVIGLMSGTSADGIDAVLIEISGANITTRVRQLAFVSIPYDEKIRVLLLDIAAGKTGGSETVCALNFLVGELCADACDSLLSQAGIDASRIDFVGSHGHTIFHAPLLTDFFGKTIRSTLQIGEASIIAERLGCPVVSDFRVRDMAAGGLGAPLVPYTEFLLYRKENQTVALQNIGGIGNITIIPAHSSLRDVYAFDTGPGNMVMDAIVARTTQGALRYDDGGEMASRGSVDTSLLRYMLDDPYLSARPPKTTGREMYGVDYMDRLYKKALEYGVSAENMLATATRFTAETIKIAIEKFCSLRPDSLIVGGGGSKNPVLLGYIAEALPGCSIVTNEQIGLDSDSKEAVAFAVLANETMYGSPNNAPGATGAAHQVIMGKISF